MMPVTANASEGEPAPSVTNPVPMSASAFVAAPRLASPALSPDGRYVAYLRRLTDWSENESFDTLVVFDRQTGEDIPTFQRKDATEDLSAVVWLPNSTSFVTILDRKTKKKNIPSRIREKSDDEDVDVADEQVWLFDIPSGSLSQLTYHPTDVGGLTVSPDGKTLFFTAQREDPEDPVPDADYTIDPYSFEETDELWQLNFDTLETHRVFDTEESYLRGYSLSEDGQFLLHMRAPGPEIDDRHQGELWRYAVENGELVQLTQNNFSESRPRLSPNNQAFAFIATVNEDGDPYYEDNLFIQRLGDNQPTLLLPDLPMEMMDFSWDESGENLLILGNTGLRQNLYEYNIATQTLTALTQGDHVVSNWTYDPELNLHVFRLTSAANPGEIMTLDANKNLVAVSDEYSDWSNQYLLPEQRAYRWQGLDDQSVEGLLILPIGWTEGDEPFPLVTITHGGPRLSAQFGSWNTTRAAPVLTGLGYGILLPNHRGGTGYGDDFMRDMVGGYFRNADDDVMAGIDALIAEGFADPDQLIKMGWSAGGHMTNWLITQTDRFKAASSGAGVSDWVSMYGESDVRHNRTPWFGAAPWEEGADVNAYRDHSPLPFAYQATTPTLFYAGGRDVRVPPTQSIMMFRALEAYNVPTQLFIAPRQPHGFRVPGYRLFKINTDLSWFAEHLGREPYDADIPQELIDGSEKDAADDKAEDGIFARIEKYLMNIARLHRLASI